MDRSFYFEVKFPVVFHAFTVGERLVTLLTLSPRLTCYPGEAPVSSSENVWISIHVLLHPPSECLLLLPLQQLTDVRRQINTPTTWIILLLITYTYFILLTAQWRGNNDCGDRFKSCLAGPGNSDKSISDLKDWNLTLIQLRTDSRVSNQCMEQHWPYLRYTYIKYKFERSFASLSANPSVVNMNNLITALLRR